MFQIPLPVQIVELVNTGVACPTQWDAKDSEGRVLYIRYRWGHLSVRRAPTEAPGDPWHPNSKVIFGKQLADDLHGCMSDEELATATQGVLLF